MSEALLAVEETLDTNTSLLRLVQNLCTEIAVYEVPEMLSGLENVRERKKNRLGCAVGSQSECRDTGHIDVSATAEHRVKNVLLCAEYAGCLKVDGDGTTGDCLNSLLELGIHLSADSTLERVNLSHGQGNRRISCCSLVYSVLTVCCCGLGRLLLCCCSGLSCGLGSCLGCCCSGSCCSGLSRLG